MESNTASDTLLSHLKETEVTDVEKFSQTSLYVWFNNFVDFIQENDSGFYNEACKYADEREEDSI